MKNKIFLAGMLFVLFAFSVPAIAEPNPGGTGVVTMLASDYSPLAAATVRTTTTFPAELGVLDIKSKAASGVFLALETTKQQTDRALKALFTTLAYALGAVLVALLFTLAFAPYVLDLKSSNDTVSITLPAGIYQVQGTAKYGSRQLAIDGVDCIAGDRVLLKKKPASA